MSYVLITLVDDQSVEFELLDVDTMETTTVNTVDETTILPNEINKRSANQNPDLVRSYER